ncbi:MAG: amino acid ABC transporter permease [Burkholderiales bacterium]|nr:amino acid ABC transporter permease [Burkholderiales bacterium]
MLHYQWNWAIILEQVPGTEEFYYQWLIKGLELTLATALSAWLIALVLGSLIGIARTVPNKWLSALATAYVEIFRNIPLLAQLFFWFFVLPELLPEAAGDWMKQSMPYPEFITGVFGLGLFTAARVAEQIRTGILALPRGQKNAGLAMGFTLGQTYRHVLLPMAFRIVIPPLTSEFMNMFKNSAVCYGIGLTELYFQLKQITGDYAPGNGLEVAGYVTLIYLAMALVVNRGMAWVERKVTIPGTIGGTKK